VDAAGEPDAIQPGVTGNDEVPDSDARRRHPVDGEDDARRGGENEREGVTRRCFGPFVPIHGREELKRSTRVPLEAEPEPAAGADELPPEWRPAVEDPPADVVGRVEPATLWTVAAVEDVLVCGLDTVGAGRVGIAGSGAGAGAGAEGTVTAGTVTGAGGRGTGGIGT
jgi:hypothetical protein